MENYSRPATLEDLKALIRALNDHGVDYLLIGGYVVRMANDALEVKRISL